MNRQPRFAQRTAQLRRSPVRELLRIAAQPGTISFAGGLPAPELFPVEEIGQAAAAALRSRGARALQYGQTEGLPELRDWIAARFSRPQLRIDRENVLIVTGSQQALDLIGRVFIDPGDLVLVEDPTYLALLSAWRPLNPKFVSVPSDAEGACVDLVPAWLKRGARLAYLVPNFQNPQGTTLSAVRRHRLANDWRQTSAFLVEDDPYGELRYEGEALPSLLELGAQPGQDGQLEARILAVGSFSKVLAPGLRVGWVIGPREVIEQLVRAKQAADLHTSTFCQETVLELLRAGTLDRQIPRLRQAYRLRRDTLLAALSRHFPAGVSWTRPAGGMFLLVTLPETLAAVELLEQASALQVAFVPGDDFHLSHRGRSTLRLNFSHPSPERIEEGITRLGRLLAERLEGDARLRA